MLLLIVAGIAYTVWADSLPVAVLTAALVLYRAHRPSTFWRRVREARYLRSGTDDSVA